MMRKIFSITLFSMFMTAGLTAQNTGAQDKDPAAKEILEKVNDKYDKYKSLSIDFVVKLKGDGINETISGNALKQGDKYVYDTEDYKVTSDGRSVWTYVKEDNTVTISSADDGDEDSEMINPTKVLTMWKEGFKYKLVGAKTVGGKKTKEIRLYPENPKKAKFHTVTLYVDEAKNEIAQVKIKGRDGVDIEYSIKSIKGDVAISSSKFKFDSSKYPGIEENDMRF